MPATTYRKSLFETQNSYDKRIQRLFNKAAYDISALASDPSAKFSSSFDFSNNVRLNKRIDAIMLDFHDNVLETIQAGSVDCWNLSNDKNDMIVNEYLTGLTTVKGIEKYFKPNAEALQAFITRKRDTFTLSDRIWKIADQYRRELELHLGYGILNGDSADTISRRIRYYQANPEMLFRRVRDKNGNLVLSQRASEYHPGRGIYRSSYKNAMRLSRTETNMSYREADFIRWNQLDFVSGIKISLSSAHPKYNYIEVCEAMAGHYPKGFKWSGWHTQCLCISTPVLMSKEDFLAQLEGREYTMPDQVTEVPDGFKNWISENSTRVSGWRSAPYWVQDNFKNGDILRGLKVLK